MGKPLNNRFSSCIDKHQQVDQKGESGKCNVCSAPCSSCFHNDKVSMKPGDESSGENCTEIIENGPNDYSMTGMTSNSDSYSESALVKGSSRALSVSALDDKIPRSQSGCQSLPEVHDDCLSGVSETDEKAIKKCHLDDDRFNKQGIGECAEGTLQDTSVTTLHCVDTSLGKIVSRKTETMEEASNQNDDPQKKLKEDKSVGAKNELLKNVEGHMGMVSRPIAPADADISEMPGDPVEKKEGMPLEIQHVDETEDSDMVEQDVKVCDICGDAGREDLLAICSRCSDGAEHTYCMREMLDKVPEGDWLCEECQNLEKADSERRKQIGRVSENEKNHSSGHTSGEYVNATDVEGQKRKDNPKVPSKRHRDDTDAEVSSKLKKPAIESSSPKTLRPGIAAAAALTRTSSSRTLEKFSSEIIQVNEITELTSSASESRLKKVQGSFLKSNSFNSLNLKPKVKPVDQVIRRQKSVKEHASGHRNEDVFRSIGKSTSFKSANSVRSEPKVKMLTSRPSDIQVVKSSRQRTPFERQMSVKGDHSPVTPSASSSKIDKKSAAGGGSLSRIDKKSTTGGESSFLVAAACKQETKPVQTENATASLSRSSSLQIRKAVDPPPTLGDSRRPSPYANSSAGVSSGSGIQKVDKRNPSLLSVDGGLPDGLSQEGDSSEQTKASSGSCFARSSTKPSKDEALNVRAAIEAAILKKPVTYLRNRNMGQSDASTISSTVCEVGSHQDCRADSSERKKVVSDTEQADACQKYNSDSVKQDCDSNLKQLFTIKDQSSAGQYDAYSGNSSRNHLRDFPVAMTSFMKRLAIPEHECVWQGSFEVFWSGKNFKPIDGIQAHLSSAAAPKVSEAVKKFKTRIVLNEVPRVSSWPTQFQMHGVRDDNIALFFFAKDLESYNKVYKVTVDNMIKKDLAFKGNVDGVELLIFPSNLLPDISQRWNMLFFLWGVFRAKKESCLQLTPGISRQVPPSAYQVAPKPIVALADDGCSTKPTSEVSVEDQDLVPVLLSEGLQSLKVTDADRNVKVSPPDLNLSDQKMNSSCEVEMHDNTSQDVVVTFQKESIITPQSPPCGLTTDSGVAPNLAKVPSFNTESLQHLSRESTAISSVPNVVTGNLQHSNHPSSKVNMDAGETSVTQIPAKKHEGFSTDLNAEPDPSLSDDDESEMPMISELPLRFGYTQGDTRNAIAKVEPFNTERYFFPIKSAPTNEISLVCGPSNSPNVPMPQQDNVFDQTPILELALGTETIRSGPGNIWPLPLLSSSREGKVTDGQLVHGEGTSSSNANEVSLSAASLSLSLSFPFPEKDKKPDARTPIFR